MRTEDMSALLREVAAEVILPRFRRLERHEIDQKQPGDYVTAADRESEEFLTRAILAADPGALVVGEEAAFADPTLTSRLPAAEVGWVIDPVDGTRNFVRGKPDFAVMVAETRGGQTVRSWIYQPLHEHLWVAERGAGVERDGVAVPRRQPPSRPLHGTASQRRWIGLSEPGRVVPVVYTSACCGVDYPRIVDGGQDFVCYHHLNPWDHLPGALMVREVGGVARLHSGEDYGPASRGEGLLVAADPAAWDDVAAVLLAPPAP